MEVECGFAEGGFHYGHCWGWVSAVSLEAHSHGDMILTIQQDAGCHEHEHWILPVCPCWRLRRRAVCWTLRTCNRPSQGAVRGDTYFIMRNVTTTAFWWKGFLDVDFVRRDHAHHHVVYKRRFDYTNDLTVSYICDIGAVTTVTPRDFPVALDCFRQDTPSSPLRS